jgi:hypothetical protein
MSCENRLGKLEIPNGLAGPPGTAGINGAGWASGAGNPVGTPAADILFWLNINSGELFKWTGSVWDPIVDTIFGTDGNLWLTGTAAPTAPTTEGNFYYRTTTGDIYQYLSGSWGGIISNIKGTNGTNGTNGVPGARVPIGSYNQGTLTVGANTTGGLLPEEIFTLSDFFPKIGDWIKLELDTSISRPNGTGAGQFDYFSFDIVFSDNGSLNYSNLEPNYTPGTVAFNSLALSSIPFVCTSSTLPSFITDTCSVNITANIYRISNSGIAYTVKCTGGNVGDNIISRVFRNTKTFNFNNTNGAFKINVYNYSPSVNLRASTTTVTVEKYEMP